MTDNRVQINSCYKKFVFNNNNDNNINNNK